MSKANWNRKTAFTLLLSAILVFGTSLWFGYSYTGTINTWAPGSFEGVDVNFTGDWYRGSTNLTDRLLGTWGALTSTSLDTGQGAYELYGMDQDVLTTSSPTFDGLTSPWIDLGGSNRTTWPTGGAIPSTYEYFIDYNGTYHRVWDGRAGESTIREDLTDVNLDTAIENSLADDSGPISIKLGPNCDGAGRNLTLDRSRFSLYTGLTHDHQESITTPRISRILIVSDDDAEIRDVYIQGLSFNELDFYANESSIQAIFVDQCYMQITDTLGGLMFRETDTLGSHDPFIDWIRFVDFKIHDKRSQAVPGEGAITFKNKDDGTGQFWFERLKYHQTTVDDAVFMCFDTDSRVSPTVWITEPSFSIFGNRTVLFKVKSGSYIESIVVDSPWVEIKENFVMLEIDTGVKRFRMNMDNSQWTIGLGVNVTIIENGVANWWDWHGTGYNGLWGEGNIISTSSAWTGTFSVGTLNLNQRFNFQWSYNHRNWNTTESEYVRSDHGYLTISPQISSDHFYDGITTVGFKAGQALQFNDLVFLNVTGFLNKTDADLLRDMPCIGINVDPETGVGTYPRLLTQGYIRDDSWNWPPANRGDLLYVSTTAGDLTLTAPSGTGDQVQAVAFVVTPDIIYFNPTYTLTAVP